MTKRIHHAHRRPDNQIIFSIIHFIHNKNSRSYNNTDDIRASIVEKYTYIIYVSPHPPPNIAATQQYNAVNNCQQT